MHSADIQLANYEQLNKATFYPEYLSFKPVLEFERFGKGSFQSFEAGIFECGERNGER